MSLNDTLFKLITKNDEATLTQIDLYSLVEVLDQIEANEFETAYASGRSLILELLIRDQYELAHKFADKTSTLMIDEACALGKLSVVKKIIAENPKLVHYKSAVEGFYPIHLAAGFSESLETVEYLVEQGADVNVYSDGHKLKSIPPLIAATLGGDKAIVEFLLKSGADLDALEVDTERSAFDIAKKNNRFDLAEILAAREE